MTLSKSKMYKIYFLVMKIVFILSAIFVLKMQLEDFTFGSLLFSSMSLLMIAIQLVAILKAEKFIEERNYIGVLIGIVISVLSLGSMMFPLGVLGLYSLLNREFMEEHKPKNAPEWFNENLINSKILNF